MTDSDAASAIGQVLHMPRTVRALVVEDNAEMRYLLTQMLRQLTTDVVHTAGSFKEAVHLLGSGEYNLVLIDVGLSENNGIDIIRKVRADADNRHRSTPMLVVTGQNQLGIVKAAIDAGADSFVAKPVSLLTLADHVDRVLHHRRPLISEAPNYFGPDRRRGVYTGYTGPERRNSVSKSVEWL